MKKMILTLPERQQSLPEEGAVSVGPYRWRMPNMAQKWQSLQRTMMEAGFLPIWKKQERRDIIFHATSVTNHHAAA